MSTHRRPMPLSLLALVAVVALASTAWIIATALQPRKLRVEAFSQVQIGMTQKQVEDLLGGPPGDYGANVGGAGMMTAEGYISPPGSVEKVWFDDSNHFEIFFDNHNRVVGFHKRAGFEREPPPSLWVRFLRFLGI